MSKKTVTTILEKKKGGQKITMLTAYDYPLGCLVDAAGVDIVLVGDSLANVVLGLESTREIGMPEMLHHTKAVRRAVKDALLVADMPYGSFHKSTEEAVANARRFVDEAGAEAVKMEWFDGCLEAVAAIVQAGIPVMAHVGLTPQTAENFKVQGKDAASAQAILKQTQELEKCGCFSIVLECIPAALAAKITAATKMATIGIGAGAECDGQVLVTPDLLGLFDRFRPKFAKQYVHLSEPILAALKDFVREVEARDFPTEKHSFHMPKEDREKLESL